MEKLITKTETILADTLTPVSVYLRTRDIYPGAVLLESTDFHHLENCYSFICLTSIATISVEDNKLVTVNMGTVSEEELSDGSTLLADKIHEFVGSLKTEGEDHPFNSFFGYLAYDAVKFFDTIELRDREQKLEYPELRFDLFRYIIAFNHLKNEIILLENRKKNEKSGLDHLRSVIFNAKITPFSFRSVDAETSNMTDEEYMSMVKNAKDHCKRGDVFQVVMSRAYSHQFKGDEFNVYRCLRSLNPSPYLFYFDYGSYKIFGSSPESQITIEGDKVSINPIAGTFGRTGDDNKDKELSLSLAEDPKENAEHIMLVDLARNDLSRNSDNVFVENFKEIHFYSHLIHIVSKVSGNLRAGSKAFKTIADSFPAGTLSGAPKYRAMELIDSYEPTARGFYGGCIGLLGLNGDVNLAITIRSFLSRNNSLHYQAGAGIVMKSDEEKELEEVNHKLGALKSAIELANNL